MITVKDALIFSVYIRQAKGQYLQLIPKHSSKKKGEQRKK